MVALQASSSSSSSRDLGVQSLGRRIDGGTEIANS